VKAIFHTAEGFLSYWVRNIGMEPGPDEIAAAEASAREALETAERLEDVPLISASLDALAAVVQTTRPREAAALQARRLQLEQLDYNERGDAYYTRVWLLAVLGDLEGTVRTASEGLGIPQSPQDTGFLGIAAWAAYALALLGRWDEVADWAARERASWIDNERPSAAFIVQGFYSALAVARARQDEQAAETWREILDEILRAFSPPHPTAALSGLLQPDVERLVSEVLVQHHRFPTERYYHLEHVLGLVTDRGVAVPLDTLEKMAADGVRTETPLLEAQARRALGLAKGDASELRRALALFERLLVTPAVARVRIELGTLTSDEAVASNGIAILEELGDVEHLGRVRAG
jgi:tetratricopeptide (TPR) repeat protein